MFNFKNSRNSKTNWIAFPVMGFSALAIVAGTVTHYNHASRHLATGPEIEAESPEAKVELEKMTEVRDALARTEVSTALGISGADLRAFVTVDLKLGDAAPEAKKVWADLFNDVSAAAADRNATADDLASAGASSDDLGAYIKLERAGLPNDLGFRPADLLEATKTWTVEQKQNLASTLQRAGEIARQAVSEGKAMTTDEAFKAALKEAGRLEKYEEGCEI